MKTPIQVQHKQSVCAVALTFRIAALLLTALSPSANAQVIEWARQFGTGRVEEAFAVAIGPNAVYVAGETFGAFEGYTNAGNLDVFIRKYDLAGNPQWTRQFGTSSNDSALGLAADATGVYLVGRTDGAITGSSAGSTDAFVRKYDTDGNELWTRQFGTTGGDQATGAAVDSSGVYVSGFAGFSLPGQSAFGAFVRKYDRNGAELWTRQFGTPGDIAFGVAADTTGVYVAGSTIGPLVSPAAGTDAFLRKYDASGTAVWTRQINSSTGPNGNDAAYAVAVSASGVYISGATTGTFPGQSRGGGLYDAWARKYDVNGVEQWTRQYGASDEEKSYGIAATSRWVYVAYISGWETVLKRLDPSGTETGELQLATADREYPYAVAVDANAAYFVASKDGFSLGQTPAGDLDALLVKVPHPPEVTGVSDAFTGQAGVAPTTWIAIYGNSLSASTRTWDGAIQRTQLPATLDGVTVSINGRPATMYFVSPNQVNVLGPLDETTGNVQLTVTNANGVSPAFQVRKSDVLPAFYAPFGAASGPRVTGVTLDGALVGAFGLDPRVQRPVRPGEIVQFFATGFGRTNPPAPSDQLFVGAPEVANRPRITIGGREAAIFGNGNLVGPGLFQFNLTIPDLADGDHAMVAEVGSVRSSATVFLPVRR